MPAPLSDDKREAILSDIKTGQKSRNRIARDHGVSVSTVTKLAPPNSFDRSQTKRATEAAVTDAKARRAEIARKFLEKADRLLDQMEQPHIVFNIGGKDNVYTEHLMDRPPTADIRNLMTSAAIAFDKHLAADRHDADSGTEGARSVLGALGEALQIAAERIDGEVSE